MTLFVCRTCIVVLVFLSFLSTGLTLATPLSKLFSASRSQSCHIKHKHFHQYASNSNHLILQANVNADTTKRGEMVYVEPTILPCIGPHRSLGSQRCLDFNTRYLKQVRRWYTPILQYMSQIMCYTVFGFVMKVMNRFHHHRLQVLHDLVYRRPKGQGLLTVSNHQSMADDAGLWAALLPLWRTLPSKLRWIICTEDVFFSHPALTSILEVGHVLPLDRKGSRDQPLFQRFCELIANGNWGHIYIEGRVWQNWRFKDDEIHMGPIKTGVGKLIAHAYPNDPVVLPIFHTGMDKVVPEKILNDTDQMLGLPSKPAVKFPQGGNNIHVYVGKPLNFHEKIMKFDQKYPGLLKKSWYSTKETNDLYREIAFEIENEMRSLEYEAYHRTSPAKPLFLSQRSIPREPFSPK